MSVFESSASLRLAPLAKLELVELRLQHRHRLGAIAVLRPVVLALDHDVGRQVRDANGGIGLVDVWPPAPEARNVSMRKSAGLISTSIESSTSGWTKTLANDVCRRALESKGLLRTNRCTPTSLRR
jgi:hypothetical protein